MRVVMSLDVCWCVHSLLTGLREKLTLVAKMDIIFPSAIDTTRGHLLEQVSFFLESLGES